MDPHLQRAALALFPLVAAAAAGLAGAWSPPEAAWSPDPVEAAEAQEAYLGCRDLAQARTEPQSQSQRTVDIENCLGIELDPAATATPGASLNVAAHEPSKGPGD